MGILQIIGGAIINCLDIFVICMCYRMILKHIDQYQIVLNGIMTL